MIDWESEVMKALQDQNDPESHIETDPFVFHPSQLGYCDRQCYLSKLGLKQHDAETLGAFKTGTLIHQWFEETFQADDSNTGIEGAVFEMPVEYSRDGIDIVGRCDCYYVGDNHDYVFDFKTRHGWYNFDPPNERHVDQLQLYMEGVGASYGQIVYLSKKNLEVRTYPENGGLTKNQMRLNELFEKAHKVGAAVDEGLPSDPSEIPVDPCDDDCWYCENETLNPNAFF